MSTDQQQLPLVIGVGNEYRSDDGAGLVVARELQRRLTENHGEFLCTIEEASGEGAALLELFSGREMVILVDAVSAGSRPGQIFRFEAHRERIPSEFFHYSTHAFSVAEAVELGRAMGLLPEVLLLYGIEGGNFAAGTELSNEVRAAASDVVTSCLRDLEQCPCKS